MRSIDTDVVENLFLPKEKREPNEAYLQPDMEALVERKKKNHELPEELFLIEYCGAAEEAHKLAYAYQTFCEMFSDDAKRADITRHFAHELGVNATPTEPETWPS